MAEFDKPEHGVDHSRSGGRLSKWPPRPEHHEAVRSFVKSLKPPLKLSLPALETLAVIAYKQPVTAPEIMEIRGVQGAGVLKTLLDRKLIAEAGRKNVIGKPILYKTTKEFLVQFGLKDLSELPTLKEFEEIRRMAFADTDDGTDRGGNSSGSDCGARRLRWKRTGSPAEPETNRHPSRNRTGARAGTGGLMPEERLQKILSQAGVASRRKAEQTDRGRPRHGERRGDHRTRLARPISNAITSRWMASCCAPPKHLVYIALNKPNNVSDHGERSARAAPR